MVVPQRLLEHAKLCYGIAVAASPIIGANYCVWKGESRPLHHTFFRAVYGAYVGLGFGLLSPVIVLATPTIVASHFKK
jgi:hypothetical protein